jgi:hypothetical protein
MADGQCVIYGARAIAATILPFSPAVRRDVNKWVSGR